VALRWDSVPTRSTTVSSTQTPPLAKGADDVHAQPPPHRRDRRLPGVARDRRTRPGGAVREPDRGRTDRRHAEARPVDGESVLDDELEADLHKQLLWAGVPYRQDASPGQQELLYQLNSINAPVQFADLTFANVGGTFYGYFVENLPATQVSRIERVPLTGGPAVTVATSPAYIGNRDLVTDGTALYWADAKGLRRMLLSSGTLQKGFQSTALSRVRVVGSREYFSNGKQVEVTNVTGGAVNVVGTADASVTALDAVQTSTSAGVEVAYGTIDALYAKTSLMSAPVQAGFTTNSSPYTSISIDSANGDLAFTCDGPKGSAVDAWQISPTTGEAISGTDTGAAADANSAQLDDATGAPMGKAVYFTTPTGVFRIAL
jgi:hypothetical protein